MAINKIKPDYLIGIFVLIIFAALNFYHWPLLDNFDSYLYSAGSKLVNPEITRAEDVVLLNIDRDAFDTQPVDIDLTGLNPGTLADLLAANGVKITVFSMPLGPDVHASTLKELRALSEEIKAYPPGKDSPQFREWVLKNIDKFEKRIISSRLLPDTLDNAGNIILPVSDRESDNVNLKISGFLNSTNIDSEFIEGISVDKLYFPYPELLKNAGGFGYIGSDGIFPPDDNSYQLYIGYKGSLVPSIALRTALFYYGFKPAQAEADKSKIVIKDKTLHLIGGSMFVPASNNGYKLKSFTHKEIIESQGAIPGLKDKIVFAGFARNDNEVKNNGYSVSDPAFIARQFIDIINFNYISRPSFIIYLEVFIFVLYSFFLIFFTSSKGHFTRALTALLLVLLSIAAVFACFSIFGIWLKTANIVYGTVLLYLFLSAGSSSTVSLKKEKVETGRLLGLNYQSQGELDLAYKEFKTLPLDKGTKDLIYNLGLEYENKQMIEKAIELYSYINKGGGFRDLDDRIPMLRESYHSSTIGSYGGLNDSSVLGDSSVNLRNMVGRYKIIGKLGTGSMGLVYKAQDPNINRLVAIKTIRFSDEFDEDVIKDIKERFFREAEIAGKLSHPAIVTIHDVGDDRDLTYMAMEYLEGEDLDKYIKKENLLPVRRVIEIAAQIAEALEFAHKEGVIHRDIKPANVMLLKNGQVKVTDFGIAKAISSSKTKTGVILGTPNYMSPEQIMGQKIDSKSDIFSLGVLFYQLLTGELPFHGDNLSGLLYQITQVKHASPRNYNQKIPKVCEQILDKALTKDPAKRFRNAGEMAHIIRILGEKMDELMNRKNTEARSEAG